MKKKIDQEAMKIFKEVMNGKVYDEKYLNDCHNARVFVGGKGETHSYVCDECNQSCNFHPKMSELEKETFWKLRGYTGKFLDLILKDVDSAIAQSYKYPRLQVQLEKDLKIYNFIKDLLAAKDAQVVEELNRLESIVKYQKDEQTGILVIDTRTMRTFIKLIIQKYKS